MPQVGTGITITFANGFLAEINNVNDGDISRPPIDVTHMGSTSRDYVPGKLVDQGQLEVDINFDPTANPPVDADPELITVTYPDGSTWARTGFMTNFRSQAQITPEDKMQATCTLKFTGALTVTPAP